MASQSTSLKIEAPRSFSQTLSIDRLSVAVFVVAWLWLAFLAVERPLGTGLIDPVGGISAQDEALYSHSALRIAERGGWLTPKFLERYALYKPPLLYWLSAASVEVFGRSAFSLRLPSILAGAATLALVFAMAARTWGIHAGLGVALLLASSRLFYALARMNLTDSLLCFFCTACAALLLSDGVLARSRTVGLYGLVLGLAIMTKGLAGLMPAMLLTAWMSVAAIARFGRGSVLDLVHYGKRLVQIGLIGFAIAAPWHLYQYLVHPRWFWAEYVQVEILAFAFGAPPQTSAENWSGFYGLRLFLTDPFLLAAALASIPLLRRAKPAARLLAVWVLAIVAALAGYRYRNASYLLPLIPAMAIASGALIHRFPVLVRMAAALLVLKLALPAQPWGIAPTDGSDSPIATAINRYERLHRTQDLILVFADDDFHAATAPLKKIRYALWTPSGKLGSYLFPFEDAGIAATVDRFLSGDRTPPSDWGLDSDEALHTAILIQNLAEVRRLIQGSPHYDFYVQQEFAKDVTAHDVIEAKDAWVFLLARSRDDSQVPSHAPSRGSSGSPP